MLRPGDLVETAIRTPGPSGRLRKLVAPIHGLWRQPNGTTIVTVIDPVTRHQRTCYAERCVKKRVRR